MKFDGANWVTIGSAGFSAGGSDGTSIAFNAAGEPYVGYADSAVSARATVMKFDGAAWVNVGTPGFSVGKSNYASLAFSPSGIPHLAFVDVGNSNKATVMKYDAPEGFSELQNSPMSLYPNPASDKITIDIPGTSVGSRLSILSADGREMMSRILADRKTVIGIDDLPIGVYFIKLTGEKTVATGKIIKH
jgi:hypothetical protein